jgi:protein-tyrosine-phosphatase
VASAHEVPGSVLFCCTMNAVRSPMAAAILAHLAGSRTRVTSAGVRAGSPDPYMVAVMDEIGIDVSDHEPRPMASLGEETFDLIITLSPEAHHHALELTRVMAADVEYWPTIDATVKPGKSTREATLARYRHVRDQLFSRIKTRFGLAVAPSV